MESKGHRNQTPKGLPNPQRIQRETPPGFVCNPRKPRVKTCGYSHKSPSGIMEST